MPALDILTPLSAASAVSPGTSHEGYRGPPARGRGAQVDSRWRLAPWAGGTSATAKGRRARAARLDVESNACSTACHAMEWAGDRSEGRCRAARPGAAGAVGPGAQRRSEERRVGEEG